MMPRGNFLAQHQLNHYWLNISNHFTNLNKKSYEKVLFKFSYTYCGKYKR